LLVLFEFFPLIDEFGYVHMDVAKIFAGFSNPALLAVLGLLVVGQAVVQTGALNEVASIIARISRNNALVSLVLCLIVVMGISAVLNNTPVVVIFIPILAALAKHLDISVSKIMIPLSYAAILGGMMTLVGSSTNLLVSGTLVDMGMPALGFFDFTIPGLVLATVGFVYVTLIAPHLLIDRASLAKTLVGGDDERQFIAQVEVDATSDFVGRHIASAKLEGYDEITIRMVQRGEHAYLPPFDEHMTIRSGDIVVVATTRTGITQLLEKQPGSLLQNMPGGLEVADDSEGDLVQSGISLAEVIVTPSSRMIGRNLEQVGFHHRHHCVVLGIQRQSRVIRSRVSEIRLAAGDVLLVMGKRQDVMNLQESKDILFLEWSAQEIHSGKKAWVAGGILSVVVGTAAFDIVPIAVAAFVGAVSVIVTGCLNLRQAKRSIDSQVLMIVAASLALGAALQETGGAIFIAKSLIGFLEGASAVTIMSVLFVLMAVITNVLSNNASAVLFTPIAVSAAQQLDANPLMFIFAVIFACNCSFITPIGYQTNLLVMGPGHYKFSDFIRSGLPLALIMWITYTLFALSYF